jgi:oligopeptide transport system ATP-binding protein
LLKSIPANHAKGEALYTIPGLPPDLTNPPIGCAFQPRNQLGDASLCLADRRPELVEIAVGHHVQDCPGCLAVANREL